MNINRREFLVLTVAMTAGCQTSLDHGSPTPRHERVVNAGPVANYAADGVYDRFRDQGFFIVRQGEKLFALSSFCTHRKCKLTAESDHTFYCPCHDSAFDPNGKVTEGPARRDLPSFATLANDAGQLLVTIPVK